MLRPTLAPRLIIVVTVVQSQLCFGDGRRADVQFDDALIDFSRPLLAAVGAEMFDVDAKD